MPVIHPEVISASSPPQLRCSCMHLACARHSLGGRSIMKMHNNIVTHIFSKASFAGNVESPRQRVGWKRGSGLVELALRLYCYNYFH